MALYLRPGIAPALDAVVLEAHSVQLPGGQAAGELRATLGLRDPMHPTLELQAATLDLGPRVPRALADPIKDLRLRCGQLIAAEPRFACKAAVLSLRQVRLGAQTLSGDIEVHSAPAHGAPAHSASAHGAPVGLDVSLQGLTVADGRVDLAVHLEAPAWQIHIDGRELTLDRLPALAAPWASLPAGYVIKGRATVGVDADGIGTQPHGARVTLALDGVDAQNAASTIATEKLAARITAAVMSSNDGLQFRFDLSGTGGDILAGPILLQFGSRPLTLTAAGTWREDAIDVRELALTQSGLLALSGSARLQHGPAWQLADADLQLAQLQFPAAYVSFMQLPLSSTDFAELDTSGAASGRLIWHDGAPQRMQIDLDGLTFTDPKRKLQLAGLNGSLQWAADPAAALPSHLAWRQLRAYGLEGGPTQLDFRATGRDFALTGPVRLPLFDGGLAVQRFEAHEIGRDAMQLDFDAAIEPVSMSALSRAFGWPQMAGTLAGRIPGLAYRGGELRVDGEIAAQVFDGTVSVQRLRLHDPLGKWPQLFADFRARNIDLDRITRTFPIGSITGRLDADVTGLELFDWSPVAFDARLYTTPGDRSRHRISQKAVSSLSNLGGGGGGVAAALQTGFLKFFRTFGYDRIGLSCQLRNDVCLMDGIPRPAGGFYIVKGGGLPRIDIIGNSGRVAWGQLLGQIETAIDSGNIQVK